MNNGIRVATVDLEKVRPLRHLVLRPNQPFESTRYKEDDGSLHFAALDGDRVIGIVSLHPQTWRFRGMAVHPDHQSRGVGGLLLQTMLTYAWSRGARRVWCNARCTARRFYERQGFVAEGEEFDEPGIGPHVVMAITPATATTSSALA